MDFPEEIGFIIEAPGFLNHLSGFKNLSATLPLSGTRSGKTPWRNIYGLVGLDPHDRKHVEKYSLGMRQRLGIAQALMEDPGILLLDER